MGRYYSGDIEGKFFFGIQPSDDANFFGVNGYEPNHLNYDFSKEDLGKVEKGIKMCQKKLGKNEKMIDNFFDNEGKGGYTDEQLSKHLKVCVNKGKEQLAWYARLKLGREIAKCIKKMGQCCFEAEL